MKILFLITFITVIVIFQIDINYINLVKINDMKLFIFKVIEKVSKNDVKVVVCKMKTYFLVLFFQILAQF